MQDIWPDSLFATGHVKKNYFYNFLIYIFHYLYKQNDLLLLQSNSFLKYFKKNKINNKKIIIHNPADDSLHKIKSKKTRIKFNKKYFNITYTGNIGSAQPFEKLCTALNKIYRLNKKSKP